MTTMTEATRGRTEPGMPVKPPKTIVVPPTVFSDEWNDRPRTEVAIGLRLISQGSVDTARKEAEREAVGFYAQVRDQKVASDPQVAVDVYNDALMMAACARACTDCNDITQAYFGGAAEDLVRMALTPEGARRIYDEIVLFQKGMSPGRPEADDDDVKLLGRVLLESSETYDSEDRKLIAYLLEKHAGHFETTDDGQT